MAVKNAPKHASQFWPTFIKKKIALIVFLQIFISTIIGLLLITTETLAISSVQLWLILLIILTISIAINLIALILVARPVRDLMAAIFNASNNLSSLPLPNPNKASYEKSGIREALQTIYKLSAERVETNQATNSLNNTAATNILNMSKCNFIALDENHKVIYSDQNAPTHITNSGQTVINLLFNGNDNLEAWLNKCDQNAIQAENVWTRIPDRLPNQEDRRFFDVYASYQKESPFTTVLTLVDRTHAYIADEENLDFIAFAAHELRGPITVIRGYLDVLNDELADVMKDDQQELFHRLIVSSNRLSGYIDNILNTSRYDRRHLVMNLSEDSVAEIYNTISDDMSLRAGAQNRLLTIDIPDNLPTIAADRASISEVFGNLIDNAIKYSNEGGVVIVSAKVSGDFVEVSVKDNGIGMPESVIGNLFQKFYRSHRSRETVAGTGIGLYISKAIIESHGGRISVISQDGRGSVFTVSLPIYTTVADKLKADNNSNQGLISEGTGWIKNHSMYRS